MRISAYSKLIANTSSMSADLRRHPGRALTSTAHDDGSIRRYAKVREPSVVRMGDSIAISITFKTPTALRPCFGFTIKTHSGTRISHISDVCSNQLSSVTATDSGTVTCCLSDLPLLPGRYFLDLWLSDFSLPTAFDMVADACWFEVFPADLLGSGKLPPPSEGPVFMRGRWSLGRISSLKSPASPRSVGLGSA